MISVVRIAAMIQFYLDRLLEEEHHPDSIAPAFGRGYKRGAIGALEILLMEKDKDFSYVIRSRGEETVCDRQTQFPLDLAPVDEITFVLEEDYHD